MDKTENAPDDRDAHDAPRLRPTNAFDQWFLARDVLHRQLDAENHDLLPLASMANEMQGLWDANEPILAKALTGRLPHERLVAVRATLRDIRQVAAEEERLFEQEHHSTSRLQPGAINSRLRAVVDRKRRLLQTLVSLLTSAQAEVLGVAAAIASQDNSAVARSAPSSPSASHDELPGPWVPVSVLVDKQNPQLKDHTAVRRFCDKHKVATRPGERAQRLEVHHDSFARKKKELDSLAASELERVETAKLAERAAKARKTNGS